MSASEVFADELLEVGCRARSPWDLVNQRTSYRAAVPVLLGWLDRVDEEVSEVDRPKFREGLIRALGVKEARGGVVAAVLVREFQRPELDWSTRWATANSLSVVADGSVFDDLVLLAQDRSYGRAREMLMPALVRSDKSRAGDALIGLLDDEDLVGHAIGALGQVGATGARAAIEQFVDHPKPWVRKEAKKALMRLAV